MKQYQVSASANFYMIGLDHYRTPVDIREQFSLDQTQASHLIYDYKQHGGDAIMILSTCNRTEIYAFANCPRLLIERFCYHTGQSSKTFTQYQNILQNREAIEHLFRVGSGMESKILGDFEIIGQIKKAYQFTKGQAAHNAFLDRLINSAVQCSKLVKNQTQLSTGAASVAFAAVMQLKDYLRNHKQPKVVLVGTGKIGRTTCENLVNQTSIDDITLINRTGEKAVQLADRFGVQYRSMAHLAEELDAADVIVVATGASEPTVIPRYFKTEKQRMLLDLSVPRNVATELYQDPLYRVIDVDHLSEVVAESIQQRRAQLPAAEALVEQKVNEFYEWLQSRRVAPTLQALRNKMDHWKTREVAKVQKQFPNLPAEEAEALASQILNRITSQFAQKLKQGADVQSDLQTIHHIFEL